jgi:hypothetical protein
MPKPDLPDLDAMEFDELWTIHEELTKILSDRILGEKRELERRLAKLNQADPSGAEGRSDSVRHAANTPKFYQSTSIPPCRMKRGRAGERSLAGSPWLCKTATFWMSSRSGKLTKTTIMIC